MTTTTDPVLIGQITATMARELAEAQGVCIRPIIRRVHDTVEDTETKIAIPCGSTRETVCPSCARKAKALRMHQCAEGWHRETEPEGFTTTPPEPVPADDNDDDQGEDEPADDDDHDRQTRSTRRLSDVPDLPRVELQHRTVGKTFTTPTGITYRPSMFLTVTLPSYGPVKAGGVPVDPDRYNYRRAALDAMLFPRLLDRFWQNLRRCAGYIVQYFGVVEPQARLAPHFHAAIRGTIPRAILRQVIKATYASIWWPSFDTPVYVDRLPVWDGTAYVDPDTGAELTTWDAATRDLEKPAHVLRFGARHDMQGIIAPSPDADRAIRYLAKYLTKALTETHAEDDHVDPGYTAHVDRMHHQTRWLPCSEKCANWLRYGVQPKNPGPGLIPGQCTSRAHDWETAGFGGRRVQVSRHWTDKTLSEHKADRAAVVRQTLLTAGVVAPEIERMAADVTGPDGKPRYVWTDLRPDPASYSRIVLEFIAEQHRWRAEYNAAKAQRDGPPVDNRSATPPTKEGS